MTSEFYLKNTVVKSIASKWSQLGFGFISGNFCSNQTGDYHICKLVKMKLPYILFSRVFLNGFVSI